MSKFLMSLKRLDRWFQSQKRILPWRDNPTFYRVWISEIMLQQTQVSTVIPYFERFIHRFPALKDLAQASEEDVLLLWSGLGYYSRARNLHRGAKIIEEKGSFPTHREGWLEIPGVGNYTAGAILSIANDQPEAILDGNVERVLSRVRQVSRQKGDTHFKLRLWKISKIFVETAHRHGIKPSVLNQSLMELGATICIPRAPRCMICPLIELCRAYQKGQQESYPPKKKPKEWIPIQESLHCVLSPSGRVLLRQRKKGEWRAGLWDLMDEDPKSLYHSSKFSAEFLGEIKTRHIVTRHKIERTTCVWKLTKLYSDWKAAEPKEGHLKWVSMDQPEVAVGSALKRTLQEIRERFIEVR